MAKKKIYINDLQDDATYNANPQAFRWARGVEEAFVNAPALEYVKVYTPNTANVDLLRNNQYRIAMCVYGIESSMLISGELVDQGDPREIGPSLVNAMLREIKALLPPTLPSPTTPSAPAP